MLILVNVENFIQIRSLVFEIFKKKVDCKNLIRAKLNIKN